MKKNTYAAKIKRTIFSFFPFDKNRSGECVHCGKCCQLPSKCLFLRYRKDGSSFCIIHMIRPFNCRKYPRVEKEHLTKETCGFVFNKP